MKPEKRLSRKVKAGGIFHLLERKFPGEVESVTKDFGLDDEVAVSLIAAAEQRANKGTTIVCKLDYDRIFSSTNRNK